MHTKLRLLPLLAVALILFASCNRVPKHARYIPKDAFMVLGVHTGEMRKQLAWSAITGSSLMNEIRRKSKDPQKGAEAFKDLENAGIDYSSTLYFYAKPDNRFENNMKMAAVLPLSDAGKLKAYINKHFPGMPIREKDGRSEMLLDSKLCISWNDEVLMAMNSAVSKVEHSEPATADTIGDETYPGSTLGQGGMAIQRDAYSWTEEKPDSVATFAEIAAAFKPAKASGIDENKRFAGLEKAGHDITFWMNYDALMDLYQDMDKNSIQGMGMFGSTIGNSLFKGSAAAVGFDFEKGSIDGLMRYYSSDSMMPVAREFAKENVDGDMLRRLPASGLNMAAGYHLSPAAMKLMLEKMGLSGIANLALMSQGITMDDILGSFSGDMVFAINNFRVETKMQEIDSITQQEYGLTPYPVTSPKMDFVFAMKIGDKAKLNKLLALVGRSGMVQQSAPNTYTLAGQGGGSMVVGDKYIAASSNALTAQAFLRERAGAMPDAVHKEISGHPVGMWADIQGFLKGGSAVANGSPSDSAFFAVMRNAFTTFSMNGGEMKGEANEYHMKLGFVNRNENSLVQLLHIAQQLSAAGKREEVVTFR